MLGQGYGESCNAIHQSLADAFAFLCNRCICTITDWLSVDHEADSRSNIEWNETKLFSGFLVIKPGQVYKLVLKAVHNIIVFLIAFREDCNMISFLEFFDRLPEGRNQACIVVDRDGIGVV